MVSRRVQKRIENDAAEKQGKTKTKKKATRKKATTRKRKAKAPERKKIYWGVFSGTLKEEGRFAYDERDKAEERLEQLRSKGKKLYFIQPIKETVTGVAVAEEPPADEEVEEKKASADTDTDDEEDDDDDE